MFWPIPYSANPNGIRPAGKLTIRLAISFAFLFASSAAIAAATNEPASPPPETPRELYNAGTVKLRDGKLEEAQDLLRAAAASNNSSVAPAAVFNLGHARYASGDRDLQKQMKSPKWQEAPRAVQSADAATQAARTALAGEDLEALVQAYQRGRSARRELRDATKAVQGALEQFEKILLQWERASVDFHGVSELEPRDTNSVYNAAIVDQHIAALIDLIKKQKMALQMAGQAGKDLKEALGELKGRVPADRRGDTPGPSDEEDDTDADEPGKLGFDPSGREGQQPISQEQAAKLLRGVQLDSNRTLPVRNPRMTQPAKRAGGDW
jgi:hypothetical protein